MPRTPTLADRIHHRAFGAVCGNALLYNACWEDPALDRQALNLGADDEVLVITSAGCNALDYALCGPRRVHAIDANPRQNALLELKLAGIRHLPFDEFFDLFGSGYATQPGGWLGVVDFFVSHGEPATGRIRHGGYARWFWPGWFGHDGVRPDPRHLDRLHDLVDCRALIEADAPVPYLRLRAPYYRFLGVKRGG